MPFSRHIPLHAGDLTYPRCTLTHGIGHHDPHTPVATPPAPDARKDWAVEMPAVLWLLDQIQQQRLTATEAQHELLRASAWRSGCCQECDDLHEAPAETLARAEHERRVWFAQQAAMTPDSHPYALNATHTRLHRHDCPHLGAPVPPPMPATQHEYATRYAEPATAAEERAGQRITTEQARAWCAKFKRGKPQRCKWCTPPLPGAWSSTTTDVPSTH